MLTLFISSHQWLSHCSHHCHLYVVFTGDAGILCWVPIQTKFHISHWPLLFFCMNCMIYVVVVSLFHFRGTTHDQFTSHHYNVCYREKPSIGWVIRYCPYRTRFTRLLLSLLIVWVLVCRLEHVSLYHNSQLLSDKKLIPLCKEF